METKLKIDLTVTKEEMQLLDIALLTYITNATFCRNIDLATKLSNLQDNFIEKIEEIKE